MEDGSAFKRRHLSWGHFGAGGGGTFMMGTDEYFDNDCFLSTLCMHSYNTNTQISCVDTAVGGGVYYLRKKYVIALISNVSSFPAFRTASTPVPMALSPS